MTPLKILHMKFNLQLDFDLSRFKSMKFLNKLNITKKIFN